MIARSLSRMLPRRGSKDIAALLLIVAASAFHAGCSRGPPGAPAAARKKVRIAVTPWPASASLYIAREKGYFRDEGLEATF